MNNPTTIASPGQTRIINSLRLILQIATCGVRSSLPLKPRTIPPIVGPSGSGKSHIVRALAAGAGIGIWHGNIANRIPLGARGGSATLVSLVKWPAEIKKGLTVLDECDKLTSPNEYSNGIRNEIFSLLDY